MTFTRTGERRYRVSVEGAGVVSSFMEPAAGYDARLPHDMAHFVVENELGITGGVFGQLASGGNAGTFQPTEKQPNRKAAKRGKKVAATNRQDALLSEKLVYIAWQVWNNERLETDLPKGFSLDDIRRVCREFDAVSAVWSPLVVGESITLAWRGSTVKR